MIETELFVWLAYMIAGFFSGSILFCKIIPLYLLNTDICMISQDHNPGAMNVFTNCGAFWGMICLMLDVIKGYIPVSIALRHLDFWDPLFALVMSAPVLGHATGLFNHFHGGKCIAAAFGVMLALYPMNQIGALLAVFYILFSTVLKINPHRLRSMTTFGAFGILSSTILVCRGQYSVALGCVLISLVAFLKHTSYFSGEH